MRNGDLFQELSSLSPNFYESNYKEIMIPFSDKQSQTVDFGGKAFTMRWQPFMYACILGIINKRSIPFELRTNDKNKSGDVFNYGNIFNQGYSTLVAVILSIISLNKEGYKILSDRNKLNEEISNYANGGFEIIREMKDEGISFGFSDFMKDISERKTAN
jgi:hypothetical protein